ncbi:monocopper oxidase-like protein SKU5 isoform X3 [Ananas comosus]|uniref:Monocopper oxidase-like protein SKU5 isoform X3 n=1 Tax=Ananas comosus TaxID=4615 RepID=A0A6P5EFB4_ANACO|nr:monocopper oxidase-like protein SKU5 isoform X3 [Ananas comosus]
MSMLSSTSSSVSFLLFCILVLLVEGSLGGDPYAYFEWEVSYVSASPLGVKQEVIAINGQYPGPIVSVTTNWNVVVNIKNNLDEPFLVTWNGLQQRKNSWQDGVLGTNCPIPSGWNWTYEFQVKDQIGSFFYFPSINFQRAAGGYGGIIINNRDVIPLPFGTPDGDITIFISDWYSKDYKNLRKILDDGNDLGIPDGVLINGFGPYRYNDSVVQDGISFERINVDPGKTYRIRVHNVGISTSLNFRIQNHNLLLVETEGSYTVQQNYTNMDIHVGQSFSFLVTMDQNASNDYYIVASARFVDASTRDKLTGVGILHYSNSISPASGPLPDGPNEGDTYFSMNQARSIRWNVSASAARPNPQGSFRMDFGTWTENSRGTYNKWDGVARSTVQVFPGAWTAILVYLDNVGIWNLRAENLNTWYLGQEVYISVVNPEISNKTELPLPDNAIFCGALSSLQKKTISGEKKNDIEVGSISVKRFIKMRLSSSLFISPSLNS